MVDVTIITPIAPHHEDLFPRCRASVEKQTIPVRHLHMVDHKKRGPGHIRNHLLKQVKTEYVIFLDADDYIEPTFVEECLAASDPERYVYTNWMEGTTEKETPDGAFWDTAWHLVTCLIHTSMMQAVGGFDETLAAMEDTDLFLKFSEFAYCGIKVKKPLVHYTNDGLRSKIARNDGQIQGIKRELSKRYQSMGCCSDDNNLKGAPPPIGKRLPGDVLVMAAWVGNQRTGGAISGRGYPRASRPKRLWVDPRDVKARPDLYRIIPAKKNKPKPAPKVEPPVAPIKSAPKRGGQRTFADMLLDAGEIELPMETPLPVLPGAVSPNFNVLNDIAQRIYQNV